MNKEQIKKNVYDAIKTDPNKEDILSVSLFGSYAYGKPKADSDIDLLIEFKPRAVVGFFKLSDIKRNLEKYLKKEVDLVTPSALSKYFRDEVIAQAYPLYEK
jgi:uncharacterized protein